MSLAKALPYRAISPPVGHGPTACCKHHCTRPAPNMYTGRWWTADAYTWWPESKASARNRAQFAMYISNGPRGPEGGAGQQAVAAGEHRS